MKPENPRIKAPQSSTSNLPQASNQPDHQPTLDTTPQLQESTSLWSKNSLSDDQQASREKYRNSWLEADYDFEVTPNLASHQITNITEIFQTPESGETTSITPPPSPLEAQIEAQKEKYQQLEQDLEVPSDYLTKLLATIDNLLNPANAHDPLALEQFGKACQHWQDLVDHYHGTPENNPLFAEHQLLIKENLAEMHVEAAHRVLQTPQLTHPALS